MARLDTSFVSLLCAPERPLANTRPRKQSQEGERAAVDAPPNLNSIAGKGFWEEVWPTQPTHPTARSIGHAPPAVPPLTPVDTRPPGPTEPDLGLTIQKSSDLPGPMKPVSGRTAGRAGATEQNPTDSRSP